MKKILSFILLILLFAIPTQAKTVGYTLTWDANSESDLAGYKVYTSLQSGVYSTPVAEVGLVTTYEGSHDIPDNDEVTFYYVVTAFDTSGLESDYSNEVSHTYMGDDTEPPAPPQNLNWFERLIAWIKIIFNWS